MAAGDPLRVIRPVVAARPQPHFDNRPTLDWLDQPYDCHGSEVAAARTKTRAEVRDPQRLSLRVGEGGLDDGGVARIRARRLGHILQIDRENAADRIASIAPQ